MGRLLDQVDESIIFFVFKIEHRMLLLRFKIDQHIFEQAKEFADGAERNKSPVRYPDDGRRDR